MTKKITALFIALVLALSVCVTMAVSASAQTDVFVIDETADGAFSDEALVERNSQSLMLEENYGYTVMAVITEDTNGLSAAAYANMMYSSLTDSKNGIILVHDVTNLELEIKYIGKAAEIFDNETREIVLNAYGYTETYNEGVEAFQLEIESVIENYPLSYEEEVYDSGETDYDNGETIGAVAEEESEKTPLLLDMAGLLSEKEQDDIEKKLKDFSKEQKIDLAIVTVDDLEGMSIEKFAAMVYDEMDYGQGSDKDGALFVRYINEEKDEKEVYIYAKGKAEEIFTEEFTQDIFDAIQEDVEAGKYASAFKTFIDKAAEGPKREINWMMLGVFVLVGMAIGMVIIVVIISKNKSIVRKNTASLYTRQGSMMLTGQSDTFIRSHVTKTAKPKNNDDDSSGGGRKM